MKLEPLPSGVEARLRGHLTNEGATFRVWAPAARSVLLVWGDQDRATRPGDEWRLHRDGEFFVGFLPRAKDGDVYRYWVSGLTDEGPKRDPHARELEWMGYPDCDCILRDPTTYPWASGSYRWKLPQQLVLYQLHVGTFWSTDANGQDLRRERVGRFLDVLYLVEHLVQLGVTGVQFLPVIEWQTARSMGYNGTDIYSPEMDYFVPRAELARYVAKLNRLRQRKQAPELAEEVLRAG